MHTVIPLPGVSPGASPLPPASPDTIHQALRLLSPTMTARIVHQLQQGPASRRQLLDVIEECNPSSLYGRLGAMRDARLIENVTAGGAIWQLTDHGRAAVPVLRAVDEWARHRSNAGPATSAVLRVEGGLRLLASAHTTQIITALAHGPLTVAQLLPSLPDYVTQYNLRVRLDALVREQVLAKDKASPRLRVHLTLDGLRTAKIHHRAAAFVASRASSGANEPRSGPAVPTLVFSHPDPLAGAA